MRSGPVDADAEAGALLAGAPGGRLVSYADVTRAAVMQGRRRQWELTLAGGTVLILRTTLDSDELQGGWAALDEAVAFLTRTRTPPATRDTPEPGSHAAAPRTDAADPSAAPVVGAQSAVPPAESAAPFAPPSRPEASFPAMSDPSTAGPQLPIIATDPTDYLRDLAATPTSGGPAPTPAPTSGAS